MTNTKDASAAQQGTNSLPPSLTRLSGYLPGLSRWWSIILVISRKSEPAQVCFDYSLTRRHSKSDEVVHRKLAFRCAAGFTRDSPPMLDAGKGVHRRGGSTSIPFSRTHVSRNATAPIVLCVPHASKTLTNADSPDLPRRALEQRTTYPYCILFFLARRHGSACHAPASAVRERERAVWTVGSAVWQGCQANVPTRAFNEIYTSVARVGERSRRL